MSTSSLTICVHRNVRTNRSGVIMEHATKIQLERSDVCKST